MLPVARWVTCIPDNGGFSSLGHHLASGRHADCQSRTSFKHTILESGSFAWVCKALHIFCSKKAHLRKGGLSRPTQQPYPPTALPVFWNVGTNPFAMRSRMISFIWFERVFFLRASSFFFRVPLCRSIVSATFGGRTSR